MADAVKRTLCLTEAHVRRFADASGDRNPLHIDGLFARRTPYGRCICHGALVTVAALGSADADALRHLVQLDIQFKQPVFPGETYIVAVEQADAERSRIEVTRAGRVAAAITVTADRSRPPLPPAPNTQLGLNRTSARHYSIDELPVDTWLTDDYSCALELLSALAVEVGAETVPQTLLVWLSAASYVVGMLVPGRDAVFVGARILRSSADSSGKVTTSVTTAHERTGLVIIEALLAQADASARMTLQAFVRPAVPTPNRSSIGRYLRPSSQLAGRRVLVVGASRGLGAALCGAFATQGANVWAGFAHSAAEAEELRREFGPDRFQLLNFDAEDIAQCRQAFVTLQLEAGGLDDVVLCAAPALYDTSLHPDASEGTLRFLGSSIAMLLGPLAEGLRLLSPGGSLVLTSSCALDDLPEPWPHYVLAKAALEGAAAYCARHTDARVLVVRPPRMWTDSTNTPMARLGAAPPEQVAAAIVRWAASEETASGPSLLRPEDFD